MNSFQQSLDRWLTTEPEDNFTPWIEWMYDKLDALGCPEEYESSDKVLNYLYGRGYSSEEAANLIFKTFKPKKMRNIVYVPLERLDSRYTAHLDRDILHYLRTNRLEYTRIDAPHCEPPAEGMFLNASETIKNKSSQIFTLAQMYADGRINDDTIIFFSDLWFPGIESLNYLNHFYKVRPTVKGIIHAGSFTDTDEVRNMERWASMFESIVFDMCHTIYVGSTFLKWDIVMKRVVDYKKIHVTGLPLDSKIGEYRQLNSKTKKTDTIIFNGRIHPEKQPHLFAKLQSVLKAYGWRFVSTQTMNLTKDEYYDLLNHSKVVVSFALQENFGYGIQEAVALGCIPVLPNRLCYKDQFEEYYLYNSFEECVEIVIRAMNNQLQAPPIRNSQPFKTWFS